VNPLLETVLDLRLRRGSQFHSPFRDLFFLICGKSIERAFCEISCATVQGVSASHWCRCGWGGCTVAQAFSGFFDAAPGGVPHPSPVRLRMDGAPTRTNLVGVRRVKDTHTICGKPQIWEGGGRAVGRGNSAMIRSWPGRSSHLAWVQAVCDSASLPRCAW
jgi:hypothetical protein